jgi:hypothetical protein
MLILQNLEKSLEKSLYVYNFCAEITESIAIGVGKYRQLGMYPHLKEAEYKYPSPKCINSLHFGLAG